MTANVYWRNIYSLLNFDRFPFIITDSTEKVTLEPHSHHGYDVASRTFRESMSYSCEALQHLTQRLTQRKDLMSANWDEMNEWWNIPFALNEWADKIKWKKLSYLALSRC